MPKHGRSRKTRALTAAGITTAVLAAGGGGVAYATSRSPAPTYVTASASQHSVIQTLQATGTTQPSSAATVSFAVSGTVATVPVAMGDKVTAGQVLATLDNASLKFAVATAQGQVANANLTLAQAESGQVSTASGTGGSTVTGASRTSGAIGSTASSGSTATGSTTATSSKTGSTTATSGKTGSTTATSSKTGSTSGTAKSSGPSRSGAGPTASIATAQKLLLATVRRIDSSLAKTKTDLASAITTCSTPADPTPTPTPSAPASAAPTPTPSHTKQTPTPSQTTPTTVAPAAFLAASPAGPTTCIQAQQLVLRDESALLLLQQGLSAQETSLDKLLTTAVSSAAASSTSGTSTSGTATAGTSRSTVPATATTSAKTGGSTGATGSSTVAVSAAQLAADQAAVDAAQASLVVAQQQLRQATIVSPINGVVSLVGLTVGQQASAGSTTTAVDVIDQSGHSVTLSVDVAKIPQVKVGQKATVVPDGSATPLAATVAYVAAAPTTSGSTAYNVELAFSANPTKLQDGIQAAVTITTAQAASSLAVPTSAINHRGALSYVLVLNGSTTKTQIITIGAIGATYTQVTQGLTTGQRVVLANPNQPIPTNTITGRVARITGGVASTSGVLGGTAAPSGARPGG